MAVEKSETAASDELAAYLATVPRGLNGDQWGRWRAKHPPPYFRWENRRGGKCGICGSELSAWLKLCPACMEREFEYLRHLLPEPKKPRVVPALEGRTLREEIVDYPEEGEHRPARTLRWFVVQDSNGIEVTRSLERDVAERYLSDARVRAPLARQPEGCPRHPDGDGPVWCQDCHGVHPLPAMPPWDGNATQWKP